MAKSGYQYTTSPRKLEPNHQRKKQEKKGNLKIVKDVPRQEVHISKEQKRNKQN